MKRILSLGLVVALTMGCSTKGGVYKDGDSENGEFSIGRTSLGTLAVVGAVAAAAAVSKGGGGGGSNYSQAAASTEDYDWAWDQFYNEYRQLVWACRGIQSGQFALQERCQYKPVNDFTWPQK